MTTTSLALLLCTALAASPDQEVLDTYLERHFETYPSRATAAGITGGGCWGTDPLLGRAHQRPRRQRIQTRM